MLSVINAQLHGSLCNDVQTSVQQGHMTCQQPKQALMQQGIRQPVDQHCRMTSRNLTIVANVHLPGKTAVQFAVLVLRLTMPCSICFPQGLLTACAASD